MNGDGQWTLEERERNGTTGTPARTLKIKNPKSTINSKEQNNITKFPKILKDVAHRKNQVGRDGGSVVYKAYYTIDSSKWGPGKRYSTASTEYRSHQRETFVKKLFGRRRLSPVPRYLVSLLSNTVGA